VDKIEKIDEGLMLSSEVVQFS